MLFRSLYPAVIVWLGAVSGGIAMTILALLVNYLVVIWYNSTKHDWFGLEWLHLQEIIKAQTFVGKFLRLFVRLGHWPAYFAISVYDPAYGFIFLRGRRSAGFSLTAVDWSWFIVSNLIGNFIWILVILGVIETIKKMF